MMDSVDTLPRTATGGPMSAPIIVVSAMTGAQTFAREPVVMPTIDHDDAQEQYRKTVSQMTEHVDASQVSVVGGALDEHEYTVIQMLDFTIRIDRF